MKQLKKMNSFTIQVLEGVDPMSDVNLAEIKGGIGCTCKAGTLIETCPCNKGSKTTLPPLKPNSVTEYNMQPCLSFE